MESIKGLIGVIHLGALPGDYHHEGEAFHDILERALRDGDALCQGGADGVIVENFGSAPFAKGSPEEPAPPHQVSAVALVAAAFRARFDLPLGINILRNDATAALGVAAVTEAAFVRVNVHAGAYVTDQGLIEGRAYHSLAYRKRLGSSVALWADVCVKHAAPLAPLSLQQALDDLLQRSGADRAIVTGRGTGQAVDAVALEVLAKRDDISTIYIGSGVSPKTVKRLPVNLAGAIVGTWLKEDGNISQPICHKRVRELGDRLRAHLN
jgi:uncharacterized protein